MSLPTRNTLLVVSLLGIVLVTASAFGLAGSGLLSRSSPAAVALIHPATSIQSPTVPSPEITRTGAGRLMGRWTDLRHETIEWAVFGKVITFNRRERETTSSNWSAQEQEISVPFQPIDVATHCVRPTYVAGFVPEDGNWIIQSWVFQDPPTHNSQGSYISIDQRRLPTVRMDQVWRGSDKGQIRNIESDPSDRFLLVLTDAPALWQVSLPAGTWTKIHDATSLPELVHLMTVKAVQHVTEGRKYILLPIAQTAVMSHPGEYEGVFFLNDANDDGQLDPPLAISKATWNALGYGLSASWGRVCQ